MAISPSDFYSAIETDSNFASRLIEREWNGRSTDKIIKWTQHIPFRLESNLIQYNSIFSKKLQRCQISTFSVKSNVAGYLKLLFQNYLKLFQFGHFHLIHLKEIGFFKNY